MGTFFFMSFACVSVCACVTIKKKNQNLRVPFYQVMTFSPRIVLGVCALGLRLCPPNSAKKIKNIGFWCFVAPRM